MNFMDHLYLSFFIVEIEMNLEKKERKKEREAI